MNSAQADIARENLRTVFRDLETDEVRYEDCWPLTTDQLLMNGDDGCWCKMNPVAKQEGYGVLDGEIAVTFDEAMRVVDVADIVY